MAISAIRPPPGGLYAVPRQIAGVLVLAAIGVMLLGVFLRYVMVPITDLLDMDPINFYWVEEVGELFLAWLTMIGAAVGIAERAHFTLAVVVHRFSPAVQQTVHVINHLLIALFGGLIAWFGFGLVRLNITLVSPALELNLGILYSSTVVGGVLIVLYALHAMGDPVTADHTEADVRE